MASGLGKIIIGIGGLASGFLKELIAQLVQQRDEMESMNELVDRSRKLIADFEPLLAEHLTDSTLAAWINGYDSVASLFPPWLQREFADSIRRSPPNEPPAFNLFSMFDREPRLRLLNVENAVKRLMERDRKSVV
jgi:hypothetical protein